MAALLSPGWASADENMVKRVEMLEQLLELKAEMQQTVMVAVRATRYLMLLRKRLGFGLKRLPIPMLGQSKVILSLILMRYSDERLTNQSSNGLRHTFVDRQYSDAASLLAGQTWSTFFNTGALPEAVDFIGPTSGTIFVRQTQEHWTKKVGDGSIMLAAAPPTGLYDGGIGFNNKFDDSTYLI